MWGSHAKDHFTGRGESRPNVEHTQYVMGEEHDILLVPVMRPLGNHYDCKLIIKRPTRDVTTEGEGRLVDDDCRIFL